MFSFVLIFDYIGILAPIILFVTSVFLLHSKSTYFKIYMLGFILNNILNIIIKNIIKEPRPSNSSRILEIAITNKQMVDFDLYGMPSGHTQTCGYNLAFITLVLNNSFITGSYLMITFFAFFQRYKFYNHTLLQLLVGLFIGISMGCLSYNVANKWIKGNLQMKLDDYAPK